MIQNCGFINNRNIMSCLISDISHYKKIETITTNGKDIPNGLYEYEMRILSCENEIRIDFMNMEKNIAFYIKNASMLIKIVLFNKYENNFAFMCQ